MTLSERHLILPFDLRVDGGALVVPENRAMLNRLFPDQLSIGTDSRFLYIIFSKLPPRPWPKTIAGLPAFFALEDGPYSSPIPSFQVAPKCCWTVDEEIPGRDPRLWKLLFIFIKGFLQAVNIASTEVLYWEKFAIIVLEHRDTNICMLPRSAGGVPCHYMYEDQMGRLSEPVMPLLTDATERSLLASVSSCKIADRIVLHRRDADCIDGTFQIRSYRRVPIAEGTSEHRSRWMLYIWCYMGQDEGIGLSDRAQGAQIRSEDGRILGFFDYAPAEGIMKDWCSAIAADEARPPRS